MDALDFHLSLQSLLAVEAGTAGSGGRRPATDLTAVTFELSLSLTGFLPEVTFELFLSLTGFLPKVTFELAESNRILARNGLAFGRLQDGFEVFEVRKWVNFDRRPPEHGFRRRFAGPRARPRHARKFTAP